MKTSYQSSHMYGLDFPFYFHPNRKFPYVSVEMSTDINTSFQRVIGRMNTGANISLLSFNTANILGITNPRKGWIEKGRCYTSTNKSITYYMHMVMIRVKNSQGNVYQFTMYPGFAKKINLDLFGMDWTLHFCMAIDWQSVHLLRD